jgi:hypothetical protein
VRVAGDGRLDGGSGGHIAGSRVDASNRTEIRDHRSTDYRKGGALRRANSGATKYSKD